MLDGETVSHEIEITPPHELAYRFALEMMQDFNVAKAAARAGVALSAAYAYMKDRRVLALIEENKRKWTGRTHISVDQTLHRVEMIAAADIALVMGAISATDPMYQDDQGRPLPLDERLMMLPEKERYAIKSITPTKFGWKVEMFDKMTANQMHGKFFNIFSDQLNVTVAPTLPEPPPSDAPIQDVWEYYQSQIEPPKA